MELSTINLRTTQLATLSACDTGVGDLPRGQGIMGLGRAFALAGADSALLSLWYLGDASALTLMTIFYEELVKSGTGKGRAEALLTSQQMLRTNGHPPSV